MHQAEEGQLEGLADEFVVLAMRTDPEPVNTVWNRDAECPVVETYSDTVESATSYRFEVKGRMCGVGSELRKALVRQGLYVTRQRVQALPESL